MSKEEKQNKRYTGDRVLNYFCVDWKRTEPKKNEITGSAVDEFYKMKEMLLLNNNEKEKLFSIKLKRDKKAKYNSVGVVCVETGERFKSITSAARYYKISKVSICRAIANNKQVKKINKTFKRR